MAKTTKKQIVCGYCGDPLTPEEIEYPFKTKGGDVLCCECEREHFYQDCDLCDESRPNEEFGKFIAVFDAKVAFSHSEQKKPGFYRVKQKPYYISNYFNAWLIEWAVEYVQPLPKCADGDGYACGDVCEDCIKKYRLNRKAKSDERRAKQMATTERRPARTGRKGS
jgi:hypothetical protein